MSCRSGGSKSRLAKEVVAEPPGQLRHEKMHALWGAKHMSQSTVSKHMALEAVWAFYVRKQIAQILEAHFFHCALQ